MYSEKTLNSKILNPTNGRNIHRTRNSCTKFPNVLLLRWWQRGEITGAFKALRKLTNTNFDDIKYRFEDEINKV